MEPKVQIEEGWNNGELLFRVANGIIMYVSPKFKEIGEAVRNSGYIQKETIINRKEYKKFYGTK